MRTHNTSTSNVALECKQESELTSQLRSLSLEGNGVALYLLSAFLLMLYIAHRK